MRGIAEQEMAKLPLNSLSFKISHDRPERKATRQRRKKSKSHLPYVRRAFTSSKSKRRSHYSGSGVYWFNRLVRGGGGGVLLVTGVGVVSGFMKQLSWEPQES